MSPPVSSTKNQDLITPIAEGFYLPKQDVYGSLSSGETIFASIPTECVDVNRESRNRRDRTFFQESESFYQYVSTSTGISTSLKGEFTMGTTLSTASDNIASLNTSVSGISLDIYNLKDYVVLHPDCVNSLDLSPSLLDDLKNLPIHIGHPEQRSSWTLYDKFLQTYGSHIVSAVYRGSRLQQWTFSKTSDQYTEEDLTTRACIDMANIPTGAGVLGIDACTNYTQEIVESVESMTISETLVVKGGTQDTRSKLYHDRSPALIEQFSNEATTDPGIIEYRFLPIWQVLQSHFIDDDNNDNFNRSLILEQYYTGFLDFDCELQQKNNLALRRFEYKSRPSEPEFACTVEYLGCHSDDDCHLHDNVGPTYCHGSTCVQAEPVTDAGSKQKEKLSIRTKRSGGHSEVPNTSCYYKVGPHARCHYTHSSKDWPPVRQRIWSMDGAESKFALFRSLHRKFHDSLKMACEEL